MASGLRLVGAVACLAALTVAAGCDRTPRGGAGTDRHLPGTRLDLPEGNLAVTAWLPDGWIYADWAKDLDSDSEIWRTAPGRQPSRVNLPVLADCLKTLYLLPHRLPDGRLGLVRFCTKDYPHQDRLDLVAYQPHTGQIQQLLTLGNNNPSQVSWRRNMRTGYISVASGICDGFAPLTRQGPVRFPRPVTLDGHTWRLDDPLFQPADTDCTPQGRASQATLTPDERHLVFAASPESQGKTDFDRLDIPYHLYIQDLPNGTPRILDRNFSGIAGIDPAPDSRHLVAAGHRGGQNGVWIIDLTTGSAQTLLRARAASPAYSPDGKQIAVIIRLDDKHSELRVIDVSDAS